MISIGHESVAIYDDNSGKLIAQAKEIHPDHNLLEVEKAFRGQGYATKILNILEEQIGEREYERVGKSSSALFYIDRGFVPYRRSNTNMEDHQEMETFFHDEEIETQKMTSKESAELLTILKKALKNREKEIILPFPVVLRRDKKESKIYKIFLKRNLKKAA